MAANFVMMPAPAGSQNAALISTQAFQGLGAGLGLLRQSSLERKDLANLRNFQQGQQFQQLGLQGPVQQPDFPIFRSRRGRQGQLDLELNRAFGGEVNRGTLPWYLWPEFKDSPEAKRARGELARVTKPFTPTTTFQIKDDIDQRIAVIKQGPQKGPGAGKFRGPDFAQADVLQNYIQETEAIGYRSLSTAQRRQFDSIWDTKMRADKDLVWNPKSKEVINARRALRAGKLPERETGQIISRGGKKWKVVGFDTDGDPLVEEVK